MTTAPGRSHAFMGWVCAHRITAGNALFDGGRWRAVDDVNDERVNAGAPIITMTVDEDPAQFIHARPSARFIVAADVAPQPCTEHRTPEALSFPSRANASPADGQIR